MRRGQYSVEQIIGILKQHEGGRPGDPGALPRVSRLHGGMKRGEGSTTRQEAHTQWTTFRGAGPCWVPQVLTQTSEGFYLRVRCSSGANSTTTHRETLSSG
jgi:hypothetical protein